MHPFRPSLLPLQSVLKDYHVSPPLLIAIPELHTQNSPAAPDIATTPTPKPLATLNMKIAALLAMVFVPFSVALGPVVYERSYHFYGVGYCDLISYDPGQDNIGKFEQEMSQYNNKLGYEGKQDDGTYKYRCPNEGDCRKIGKQKCKDSDGGWTPINRTS